MYCVKIGLHCMQIKIHLIPDKSYKGKGENGQEPLKDS